MKDYQNPSFQERMGRAAAAKQKAIDALKARPVPDEATLAARREAGLARAVAASAFAARAAARLSACAAARASAASRRAASVASSGIGRAFSASIAFCLASAARPTRS